MFALVNCIKLKSGLGLGVSMSWFIGLVVFVLFVSFLRNAPIIGPYFFKPIFDMIWFAIAFMVIASIVFVAIAMAPEGTIPESVNLYIDDVFSRMTDSSDISESDVEEG